MLNKIQKELENIKYALDQSSIVAITDQRGTILYANNKFCEITQYRQNELIGQNHKILNSHYHPKSFFKEMWATIGNGATWQGEIRNKAKDGSLYWVDTTIVPLLNAKGKPYQYISIRNDITMRKETEKALEKSEKMYRLITDHSSDLISIISREGRCLYLSPSYQEIYHFDKAIEQPSQLLTDWVYQDDKQAVQSKLNHLLQTNGKHLDLEFRMKTSETDYIYVESKVNSVFNDHGKIENLILVTRDITKRKKSEGIIHHLAFHDALTDLPNRRLFMKKLRAEVVKSQESLLQFAILFIDLDHFKYFNDSWGHETGDFILTSAAKKIQDSLRSNDTIARLGGDEFAVLLRDIKSIKDVNILAERILSNFDKPIQTEGRQYRLSCSIGISIFPKDTTDADELLNKADTALYAIKDLGGDKYTFFKQEMEERSLQRMMFENELKKAINLQQFHLVYLPKFDLLKNDIIGMEAFVRWDHPDLGEITPDNFIALAEDTGLILHLGKWMLRHACTQNKEWQEKGYPPLKVSVNVSMKQLEDNDFIEMIEGILKETRLDPKWLEIEVSERVFMDLNHSVSTLQKIRDIGVHVSIEDFGKGYSTLRSMNNLPFDSLKIDSSFTEEKKQNDENKAIVSAILSLAKSININVTANSNQIQEKYTKLIEDALDRHDLLVSDPLSSQHIEKLLQQWKMLMSSK